MKRILVSIIALLVIGGSWVALAEPTDFSIDWWTVDGGGGRSSGGDYMVEGTAGQPDAGVLSGGPYTLEGGFWNSCLASVAVVPSIASTGTTVELDWTPTGATSYNIYRGENDPYFTPGTTAYDSTSAPPWSDPDTGSIGDPITNYTYIVRGVDACGESANSKRVGEFDFAVVPGS